MTTELGYERDGARPIGVSLNFENKTPKVFINGAYNPSGDGAMFGVHECLTSFVGETSTRSSGGRSQAGPGAGFRAMLTNLPNVEVVAETDDGLEALDRIQKHRPDVAFMDITMPSLTGLEVARQTRVIGITG